jgi:integrase-like protein
VLTDRGTEYCGSLEHHEYELYLALEDIDPAKTKARHPQTNGICERFHRTIQEECYAVAFRQKLYTSLEQLQVEVDEWLRTYNEERPHSGKYCFGKTPRETFRASKHLAQERMRDQLLETSDNAPAPAVEQLDYPPVGVVRQVAVVRSSLIHYSLFRIVVISGCMSGSYHISSLRLDCRLRK